MSKWYEREGVRKLFDEEPKERGWTQLAGTYNVQTGQWVEPDDQDAEKALRALYQERFGKKPFMGWDADTLREKLSD